MRKKVWCGCTSTWGRGCNVTGEDDCPKCGFFPWYEPAYDQMMSDLKDMNE